MFEELSSRITGAWDAGSSTRRPTWRRLTKRHPQGYGTTGTAVSAVQREASGARGERFQQGPRGT
jgi:hypothetical protein